MARKPSTNYLSNRNLLAEVAKSKATYCSLLPEHLADKPHVHITDLSEVTEPNTVYRLPCADHIPDLPEGERSRSRLPGMAHKSAVNFPPFKLYVCGDDGEPVEVARSHWRGSIANGEFSTRHGNLTPALARAMLLLVDRYAMKPNWRGYGGWLGEMKGNALVALLEGGLKFNEARGENVFAFYSTIAQNAFVRTLNSEKRVGDIRDELLVANGATPSHGYADRVATRAAKPKPPGRPRRATAPTDPATPE